MVLLFIHVPLTYPNTTVNACVKIMLFQYYPDWFPYVCIENNDQELTAEYIKSNRQVTCDPLNNSTWKTKRCTLAQLAYIIRSKLLREPPFVFSNNANAFNRSRVQEMLNSAYYSFYKTYVERKSKLQSIQEELKTMNIGNIQAGIDRLDAQLQQLHQIQQYYQQIRDKLVAESESSASPSKEVSTYLQYADENTKKLIESMATKNTCLYYLTDYLDKNLPPDFPLLKRIELTEKLARDEVTCIRSCQLTYDEQAKSQPNN